MPIHRTVKLHPSTTPAKNTVRPPPVRVTNKPPHAAMVSNAVRTTWVNQECTSSCLRKIGKRPKISIEKRVKEKTCVVDGSLEASTAEAIIAEFVDMEVGSLQVALASFVKLSQCKLTVCLAHHCSQKMQHSSEVTMCSKPRWSHSL
jgi:hypothetical protein